MAVREHEQEWETEIKIENYVFSVGSFFLAEGSKSAESIASAIVEEKINRTFEKALST
jgi:hypothetical protein